MKFGFNEKINKEAFNLIEKKLTQMPIDRGELVKIYTYFKGKNESGQSLGEIYHIQRKDKDAYLVITESGLPVGKYKYVDTGVQVLTMEQLKKILKRQFITIIQDGKSVWENPQYITNTAISQKEYQLKNKIYDIIKKGIISLKPDEKIVIVCNYQYVFYKFEIFNYNKFVIATLYDVTHGEPIFTEEFTIDGFILTVKENSDLILRVEKQNRDSKSLEIFFSKPNPKALETVGRNKITPVTSQSWQGICVICYDENDTSQLCQVNCPFKHVFHCHCIDEHINTHETNEMAYPESWENDIHMEFKQECPICRNTITEKSVIEKFSFGKKKKMNGIKKDISDLLKM
jgi:hypothetical protein